MASKKERKKNNLFQAYNQNLQLMKAHPRLQMNGDISAVVLCPVCLNTFRQSDIRAKTLTLDEAPPRTAGGKGSDSILLCKSCNNMFGSQVDHVLGAHLRTNDVINFVSNSEIDVSYSWHAGVNLPATMRIREQGAVYLFTHSHRTHRENVDRLKAQLNAMVEQENISDLSFQLHVPTADSHLVNVALLRVAYLIYFKWFGYGAILHPHMECVRTQLRNPTSNVIPEEWDVTKAYRGTAFSDGLHFVYEPEDLRCVLVKFTVSTSHSQRGYLVCLPAHIQPGPTIYDEICNINAHKLEKEIQVISIPPESIDVFWHDPNTYQAPFFFAQWTVHMS